MNNQHSLFFKQKLTSGLCFALALGLCLSITAVGQQTPKPTPSPTSRRPLPKLSNGARGFNFEKSQKTDTNRLIAIGGGWGAEEPPTPRLKGRTAQSYYKLGKKHLDNINFPDAIPPLERAVKMKPNYLAAYVALGLAYAFDGVFDPDGLGHDYLLKRYRQAIKAFEQARSLAPKNADIHVNLGVLYFNTEQHQKAIDSFKRGLEFSSGPHEFTETLLEGGGRDGIYALIADAYVLLGQIQMAIQAHEQSLKELSLDNHSLTYWDLGQLYEQQDQLDLALSAYLKSISTDDDSAVSVRDEEIFPRIGAIYAAQEKYAEAAIAFRLALAGYEPALERYREGVEKENGKEMADLYYKLGVMQIHLNQLEPALASFRKAVTLDPVHATARFNLAVTSLSLGNKDEARAEALRLRGIDPELSKELEELIDK